MICQKRQTGGIEISRVDSKDLRNRTIGKKDEGREQKNSRNDTSTTSRTAEFAKLFVTHGRQSMDM
jgi:hypothetical protein